MRRDKRQPGQYTSIFKKLDGKRQCLLGKIDFYEDFY